MGRKDRSLSGASPQAAAQPRKGPYASSLKYALCFLLGAAVASGTAFILYQHVSLPSAVQTTSAPPQKVRSLGELLAMTSHELAKVDIAEMNLLCATDLRGSENLDVAKCLSRLDDWAQRARYWTDRSMWDFWQDPEKFKNSEAKFRVLLLISVLQKDFGVHYNDRGERSCDCSNSKNPFIHGMIDDSNGGTCASMPVMYVAVGRRLGYPMKLVLAKTHIFARWDDGKERFNIEGTNAQFADHPDSYYQNWPYKITEAELKQGWYLKPLTPSDELAVFLQNRAFCLMDTKRFEEAHFAFTHSRRLAPRNPLALAQVVSALRSELARTPQAVAAAQAGAGLFGLGQALPGPTNPSFGPGAHGAVMPEAGRVNVINRMSWDEGLLRPAQPIGPPRPVTPYAPEGLHPQRPGRP